MQTQLHASYQSTRTRNSAGVTRKLCRHLSLPPGWGNSPTWQNTKGPRLAMLTTHSSQNQLKVSNSNLQGPFVVYFLF